MGSTAVSQPASPGKGGGSKRSNSAIIVTALALFSMFFGAGNLIFPPMPVSYTHLTLPTIYSV